MHWRARVVAPILAGVLGVTGGVAVALTTQQGAGPSRATAFADPLNLGIPLRNLACNSSQSILVIGHGDGRSALDNGVADNETTAHYLQTAKSCQTQIVAENASSTPEYVAYLGPYPDLQAACTLRLTAGYARDYVARLKEGNTELVKCPCVVRSDQYPTLEVEPKPTPYDNVWARALQGMLHDDDPKAFTSADLSGTYDEFTRLYIQQKFQTPAGYLGRNGLMDPTTWDIVTGRICSRYTY